jgi:hypothetical protein
MGAPLLVLAREAASRAAAALVRASATPSSPLAARGNGTVVSRSPSKSVSTTALGAAWDGFSDALRSAC